MRVRGSGILLHITSLPSFHGIGDFGPESYKFADLLILNNQSFWQILPLSPNDPVYGNNPYNSSSAFAGNHLLISLDMLAREGLITNQDLAGHPDFVRDHVDYPSVASYKEKMLDRAYEAFKKITGLGNNKKVINTNNIDHDYRRFCAEHAHWLEDFALFYAIKSHFKGRIWSDWPDKLRDRDEDALAKMRNTLHRDVEKQKFLQFIFFQQWLRLKRYCNCKGLHIIGDIPIYVNYDSADVWAKQEIFKLDKRKKPISVSGVPPDYFSETGQLWGNPIYRWDTMKDDVFSWWVRRIGHDILLFDLLRIDHFRGLVAYWEVDASRKDAVEGKWIKVPTEDLMATIFRHFPNLLVIAEDLGSITPDVREIMNHFGLPGMKVLLFSFGEDLPRNPYAPHNHIKNCIVYTGTHDNNTVRGWFEREAKPADKQRLSKYLGHDITADSVSKEMIRLAMLSVADVVILPMQDILDLGEEARMNHPGKTKGNYEWRLLSEQMKLSEDLLDMTEISGRSYQ